MKNLLITIVTIVGAFSLTYYVLTDLFENNDFNYTTNTKEVSNKTINNSSNYVAEETDTETEEQEPVIENTEENDLIPDVSEFLSSQKNWKTYFNENINLSSDFIPLNIEGEEVEKDEFLNSLTSGNYIPVKLTSGEEMYQLYELDDSDVQKKIGKSVKLTSNTAYTYYQKIGTALPEFEFTDLNGTVFSSQNTKDKVLILTCWYINSKTCIKEFPKLNDLYDRYEAYEDVVFLSLAFDSSSKLKKFLIKKAFRYPVIPNQKTYMNEELEIKQYPTHLIIDEDGNIEKMVSSVEELTIALEKIAVPDLGDF